jgi:phosphomethylpyrimidine synthase
MIIKVGNIKRGLPQKEIDTEKEPIIIASIGATSEEDSIANEMKKAKIAEKYGAFAIIDHTLTPNYDSFQISLMKEVELPLSAIAVYEVEIELEKNKKEVFFEDDIIKQFELMAVRGIDMITLHASVLIEDITNQDVNERHILSTSRGGTMIMKNMKLTNCENPYWTGFDRLLKIAKEYNVVLSLGYIFRSACIADAYTNNMCWKEMERTSILVKKAIDAGVGVMVEGIGHASMDLIPMYVKRSIEETYGVPYRVLTVCTDSALGFDHVASAISSAVAVQYGASVITAVTRSEHLGLPTIEDVKEAVVSAKIAAHCGYIARTKDLTLDNKMMNARMQNGCRGAVDASICPEIAKEALRDIKFGDKKCTMCGKYCALASADEIFSND